MSCPTIPENAGSCRWRIRKSYNGSPLSCGLAEIGARDNVRVMRELLLLAIHLVVTVAKLLRPGGVRAVAAESLALKHQLLISNRSRHRAPNLSSIDRFVLGLTTLFVSRRRIPKLSAILKPATFFKFHKALVNRKYHLLFSSSSHRRKPGPKGPSAEVIAAIVEMKRRNPRFGCVRIAQQIARLWRRDRQGCRSSRARQTLPTRRLRISWPFQADVHRTYQGQPLEH